MKNKILLTILFSFLTLMQAKAVIAEGEGWSLSDDSTLTITKDINFYTSSLYPWSDQVANVKKVVIAEGVTTIGKSAFSNFGRITKVEIASTVTTIGDDAFTWCDDLIDVNMPSSITEIGEYAFCNCWRLPNIEIPSSVTKIGRYAFSGCSGLTSLTIPSSVTEIEECAFRACSNALTIIVDENNEVYDSRDNCNAIIETASNTLLFGCQSTTIPNSVTSIAGHSFNECENLTSIEIPSGVTSIGEWAFDECQKLNSVTIPSTVTTIGMYAFSRCSELSSIELPSAITAISNGLFSSCYKLTNINIPSNVTSIGERAFAYCDLTSIVIPSSVTTIEDEVFLGCEKITSIVVEDGNEYYDSRNNCNAIIEKATNKLLVGCANTVIPEDVTIIADYAFYSINDLENIELPSNLTSIGESAFSYCRKLTNVTIPMGCTTIGAKAFEQCYGIKTIEFPSSITKIGNKVLDYCYDFTIISHIENPNSCNLGTEGVVVIFIPKNTQEAYQTAWGTSPTYIELSENDSENAAAIEAVKAILVLSKYYVSIDDKEKVETARAAYDALSDEQKNALGDELLQRLENAENMLVVAEVIDAIDKLPAEVKVEDKEVIEATRAAYEALSEEQKSGLDYWFISKLTQAEETLAAAITKDAADEAAAKGVEEVIANLPAANAVTVDDKAAIEAARAAYNELTDEQKAKVAADSLEKLSKAEAAIAAINPTPVATIKADNKQSNEWYDLSGRRLQGKPSTKGLYIHNGNKVLVK